MPSLVRSKPCEPTLCIWRISRDAVSGGELSCIPELYASCLHLQVRIEVGKQALVAFRQSHQTRTQHALLLYVRQPKRSCCSVPRCRRMLRLPSSQAWVVRSKSHLLIGALPRCRNVGSVCMLAPLSRSTAHAERIGGLAQVVAYSLVLSSLKPRY